MDVMSFVPPFEWPNPIDEQNTFSKRAKRVIHENERNNLLAIAQLVLNSLLDDAIRSNRTMLDGVETREINDFFIILEKILWHGFRTHGSFFGRRKPEAELWHFIGLIGETNVELGEMHKSINEMSTLSSPISKFRAFWRLAMMQKRLCDYFQALFDFSKKEDFYEHWACIRSENCAFLCGALLALNVFDCNLLIENDQLQEQINSFELSPYLRLPTLPGHMPELADEYNINAVERRTAMSDEELTVELNQKQYLEERNRQLSANIEQMKKKLDAITENGSLTGSNSTGDERSLIFTDRLRDLERERDILHARLAEKEDVVRISQEQLSDTKRFTEDLYEKLRAAEAKVKRLQKDVAQLTEAHEREISELNSSLVALRATAINDDGDELVATEEFVLERLREEVANKTQQYMEIMSTLKGKQQEWSKERELSAAQRRRIAELDARVEALIKSEKEFFELREEHRKTKQQLVDCQLALEEFSEALSESKLRMVELKEEIMPLSEAEWVKDSQVSQCRLCDAQFGVMHRKHHCRNCGQIFCNTCSAGRVRMPSSSQPVRACLNCYHLLRNRQISAILDPGGGTTIGGGAAESTSSSIN